MLSTVPTMEKNKPKSWTIPILIGLIVLLFLALSGLATLYYSNILNANPDIIIVNQTPHNNSTNNTDSTKNISYSTQIKKNSESLSKDKNSENTDHQNENSNTQNTNNNQNNNRTE